LSFFSKADVSLYREKAGRDVENIENLAGNLQELMTDEEDDDAGDRRVDICDRCNPGRALSVQTRVTASRVTLGHI
jgi:hypothetical protein